MREYHGSRNSSQAPSDTSEPPDPSRRLVVMLGGAVAAAGVLGWRLFDWHVQQSTELSARGASSLLARSEITPRRGSILDRDDDVLAISRGAVRVVADPLAIHESSDPFEVADRLSSILNLDPATVAERLGNPNLRYSEVARGLVDEPARAVAEAIQDEQLPGIRLDPDRVRVYPNQELAAHVLGFVGEGTARPGDIVGQAGVEAWYNDVLGGQSGLVSSDIDRLGRRIPIGRYALQPPRHGSHVSLSIDRTIQHIAEQELEAAIEQFGATAGTILITNPRTGEVLGLANRPTYDPGRVHTYREFGPEFANRACSLIYEPGSTFKLVTMAAGLDVGAVRPETTHNLPGTVDYFGQEFKNWDERTYPAQTMVSVLQHSSNTGTIFVADTIGANTFYEYIARFGFGTRTGVDMAGEVPGIVRRRGDQGWFLPDLASNSFGQGISVTPLQLATAVGAIANDGVMMRPHVARAVTHADGRRETIASQPIRRVVSRETAQTLIKMMEAAEAGVLENLARVPGYRTAGKTGTSEIASSGRFLEDTSIASYIGFGPLELPQVLTLVIVERPQAAFFGAYVASPTFSKVMSRVFAHLRVPPRSPKS
ncbi:MAG: penicillin-binding protein 2 [Chloroflexi bacterium]|nr:penicillin-binding protein 2 [Chloroflexota bacterium]MCY3958799.1 penicillin-binding protein 2 [Chloroflexota bacterium]